MVSVKFLRRNKAWKPQKRRVAKVKNAKGYTGSALQGGCGSLVHSQMHLNKMQAETRLPRRSSRCAARWGCGKQGGMERECGGMERSNGVGEQQDGGGEKGGWKDRMGWKKELRKLLAEEDFQAGTLDENI